MALFFTADTHFGHKNVIKHSKRPFSSIEEMDEALIRNWNEVVSPDDVVYHLGDFAYRNKRPAADYRAELNGEIRLIIGNHDDQSWREGTELFTLVSDLEIIDVTNKKRAVLCHYPMREWPEAWRRTWHFFGHVHGQLDHNPYGFSLDVGVDSHNYRPVSVEQISNLLAERGNPFSDDIDAVRF